MVKSDGDDTLENMRIVSLEKDTEIFDDDDETIQVMRINEHGEAVEVIPGDDDDDDNNESLVLLPEQIIQDGVTICKLKDTEQNANE